MSELHFLFYNICHCHCPCDCDFHFHSHFQIKIYVSLCDLVFLSSRVKVRVGEYDASGFNPPETRSHIEYTVSFDFIQLFDKSDFCSHRKNFNKTWLLVLAYKFNASDIEVFILYPKFIPIIVLTVLHR